MTFPIHHIRRPESMIYSIPNELWELPEPPDELYIQGSERAFDLLQKLPEKGLSIVGTRNPQARSLQLVKKSVDELGNSGLILISGLARGIDAEVHRACILTGLPTIAILGCGLDRTYPLENRELRNEILRADGLIISEFPPGSAIRGYHFIRRNRLIAGWAKATWVVEAGSRSGALNTAKWSREQNRICFAVPCYPNDLTFAGNQTLLDRDHAFPFWGIHSFGVAWIYLATYSKGLKQPVPLGSLTPSEEALFHQIHLFTHQQGGSQAQDLLNWAIDQSWSLNDFFCTLRKLLDKKLISDRFGVLVSS